jgi:hypothetical protein
MKKPTIGTVVGQHTIPAVKASEEPGADQQGTDMFTPSPHAPTAPVRTIEEKRKRSGKAARQEFFLPDSQSIWDRAGNFTEPCWHTANSSIRQLEIGQ